MKHLLIASVLTMATLSGAASADDRWDARQDYEEEQREAWQERREAQREAWEERREAQLEYEEERREAEAEYWEERAEIEREYRSERREALKERGKASRRWARGEHIPRDYLLEPYYVRDYGAYELAPPPRGHIWVRPSEQDDTYYLVQMATGLISRILGD